MNTDYRRDLDGIRAIAITSVCLLHIGVPWMRAGFIGVDIFFVLSGYLITGIILRGFEKGDFTFADFYARRINRLIPALFVVLVTSWIAGWFILKVGFATLGLDILGGSTFVSNVIFWFGLGNEAPDRSLGHLWSLAVEEQFYLFWPGLLFLVWRTKRSVRWTIIAIIEISFLANIWQVRHSRGDAAFYLPLGRMWEILAGSLLYHIETSDDGFSRLTRTISVTYRDVMSVSGISLLVFTLVFVDSPSLWPGLVGVLPVFGSMLLIAAGPDAIINRTLLSNRIAVKLGIISYALYLWHWPLIVFTRNLFDYKVPAAYTYAILPTAVLLASLSFNHVERPIRYGRAKRRTAVLLLLSLAGTAALGLITYENLVRPRHLPSKAVFTEPGHEV